MSMKLTEVEAEVVAHADSRTDSSDRPNDSSSRGLIVAIDGP